MGEPKTEAFATVTFAVYDDVPIACQGDDDQGKIRVVTQRLEGGDIHAAALRLSVALGTARGSHVQVWDIEPGGD